MYFHASKLLSFVALGIAALAFRAGGAPAPTTAPTTQPAPFESEIAAFEAADAGNPPASNGIVFYGSSSIRKWDVKKSFPELPVLNRGFGGSTMADAVAYEHRVIPATHPKIVVLYEGDNDISENVSPAVVADGFEKLADSIHEDAPDAKVIFISIKPSISRWAKFGLMKQANELIQARIATRQWVKYLDIVPLMLDKNGQPIPTLYQADHLHMTDAGYLRWSNALRPLLK